MNKKLRLLVTTKCPNKCPMCCNNQFDFDKLPVVDRWDYDEIMISSLFFSVTELMSVMEVLKDAARMKMIEEIKDRADKGESTMSDAMAAIMLASSMK